MTIRDLRVKTGLSQKEFAEKFQIPIGTIRRWDQGQNDAPKYIIFMMERIIELEELSLQEGQE